MWFGKAILPFQSVCHKGTEERGLVVLKKYVFIPRRLIKFIVVFYVWLYSDIKLLENFYRNIIFIHILNAIMSLYFTVQLVNG